MEHFFALKVNEVMSRCNCSLLEDRGFRVRFPAGAGNFSLHHRVHNGSGAHPASYPVDTRGSFPGSKTAGG
jgi:hypothetical protein